MPADILSKRTPASITDAAVPEVKCLRPQTSADSSVSSTSESADLPAKRSSRHFRIVICLLSTIAATMAMSNPLVLNFTILCIVNRTLDRQKDDSSRETSIDYSDESSSGASEFAWTTEEQSTALSAFSWGAIASVIPISWLMQRFGARQVFAAATIISSVATVLCPLALIFLGSFPAFLLLRVLQGLGYCAALPMLAAMTSRWSALTENGRFMGPASCCVLMAPMLAMPISGLSCTSSVGWPLAYYAVGGISAFVAILWVLTYRNYPDEHPLISDAEKAFIQAGRSSALADDVAQSRRIPYKAIFTSMPVLAIVVATFGNMYAIQLLVIYMPTYLKELMHFDTRDSGFWCALPNLCHILVKLPAGFLCDQFQFCGPCKGSETFKVRLYNTISFVGMAAAYVALSFVGSSSQRFVALALFCLASGVLGFNVGSFFKSVTLVARMYSSLVMGLMQLTTSLVMLILPYIVGPMITPGTFEQWQSVMLMCVGVLLATNVVFCVWGNGDAAPWALVASPTEVLSRIGSMDSDSGSPVKVSGSDEFCQKDVSS